MTVARQRNLASVTLEKRWVSVMYFIVDKRFLLFSELLIDGSPREYSFD